MAEPYHHKAPPNLLLDVYCLYLLWGVAGGVRCLMGR